MVLGLLLSGNAYTHEGVHKPLVCIPESERTEAQKKSIKMMHHFHRLHKIEQDCLILKIQESEEMDIRVGLERTIMDLEKKLQVLEEKINKLEKENKELKDKLNQ